jgi:hypothetical protein
MSCALETLKITYGDTAVSGTFFAQSEETDRLALILPGAGYTTMGPMLYYTLNALLQRRSDTLALEYGPVMSALESKEDRLRALSRIPLDALNTVLQRKKYRHLTAVGKSMGTMALALLSRDAKKREYMPQSVESLWLTPLLKDTTIVGEIPRLGQRQYVVTGNQDVTHYSREGLESLPQSVEAVTVQGANHGLDIEGDALASTRVMTSVMEGISRFLDRSV